MCGASMVKTRWKTLIFMETHQHTLEKAPFTCDQCDAIFKTKNGLNIHIGKAHKVKEALRSPEKLRETSPVSALTMSPTRESVLRITPCHNCCGNMSPTHLCHEEPVETFNCNFCKEVFNCEDELARHKTSGCKQQFVCQICGVVFDLEGALRHKSDCCG